MKGIIKRLFCRHKNRSVVPAVEFTLADVDNMRIGLALGLKLYFCGDCESKFYDWIKDKKK